MAVQQHSGDVPAILKAITAIPLHLSANDDNAEENHLHCPFTTDSWCRYQSAKFNGQPISTHPNFLGDDATSLIFELFADFGYDTAEFVNKVSTGLSSNHNESLHNVLFTMAPKTDAIGMEVMRLASALAVIRYNEGFAGIERLFGKLDIEITDRMRHNFELLDTSRAGQKQKIVAEQQKRYRKKQGRGRAHVKQKSKHGPGYSSGKYSGAISSKLPTDSSSEEGLEAQTPPPQSPTVSPVFPAVTELNACKVCKGTEENRLVGIGLGLTFVEEEVDWVGYDKCGQWYHTLCLDIEDTEDLGEHWYCIDC